MKRQADELARVTRCEYDDANRRVAESQLLRVTDPLGRVTSYEYDRLGRQTKVTQPDPDGPAGPESAPIEMFAFDGVGNLLTATDPRGNSTTYGYDAINRRIRETQPDPDGAGPDTSPVTTFTFDAAHQMLAVTDPLNRTTTFAYDNLGRRISVTRPNTGGPGTLALPFVFTTYDAANRETSRTDARGNVTRLEYDNLHRLVRVIEPDPDGNAAPLTSPISSFTYDLAGQQLSESDPLNRVTRYEYDQLGRRVNSTDPDPDGPGPQASPITTYTFDAVGNQLSITDPLGHVTQYEYEGLYRLVTVRDEDMDGPGPLGRPETKYRFDLVGNLTSLTDPVGNVTDYGYDQLDRQISESIDLGPVGQVSRLFAYDSADNLVRRVDRNGRTMTFSFDALQRQTEERWLDVSGAAVHSIRYQYDRADQLLVAEDVTIQSRQEFTYDARGRATQAAAANGGPVVTLQATFDDSDLRTQVVANVGNVPDSQTDFAYDGLDRRTLQTQQSRIGGAAVAPKRIAYEYNAAGQFASIVRFLSTTADPAQQVATQTFEYDSQSRLVAMRYRDGATILHDFDYSFDDASRITRISSSIDSASDFAYDQTDQLTSADNASRPDEAYAYDENGNRTSANTQTGLFNRLATDGTFNYEYDAEGNRTRRTTIATNEVTEYIWDYRNRLTGVLSKTNDQGPVTKDVRYTYDVFNQWITRIADLDGSGPNVSETTRFIHDGHQIVLQMDGAGNVTHRYLWGPSVDQLLADENALGEVLWPLTDHLGTVHDLIDSAGTIVNHLVYDSFGNLVSETNATVDHLFGFTGRPFDSTTGLKTTSIAGSTQQRERGRVMTRLALRPGTAADDCRGHPKTSGAA